MSYFGFMELVSSNMKTSIRACIDMQMKRVAAAPCEVNGLTTYMWVCLCLWVGGSVYVCVCDCVSVIVWELLPLCSFC